MAGGRGGGDVFTSHVLLALKHDKGISSVGLLLLVGSLIGMGIGNDTDLC